MEIKRALIWVAVSTKAQVNDDKVSLKIQEEEARAVCERNGWRVVDTLRVPGHSRDYIDIHECAADMRKHGIDAFDRLIQHWQDKDFDVIVVRDGDRFARTQTLHSHVVEKTIRSLNKAIYVVNYNTLFTRENFSMWNTFSGWKASEDNLDRVRKRTATMDSLIERGAPYTNGRVLWTHRLVRSPETGKIIDVEVREELRPVFTALAELLLSGTPYDHIGGRLFEDYGYVDTNGEPYTYRKIYRTLMNPCFWGHTARNFRKNSRLGIKLENSGLWMFDEGDTAPDGVRVAYNTHEPVFSGGLGERIKAEIRRRMTVVFGKTRPQFTYAFSGLVICGECGYSMVKSTNKTPNFTLLYMRCNTPYVVRPATCTQRKLIKDGVLREFFQNLIRQFIEGASPFSDMEHTRPDTTPIEAEIKQLDEQINRLIVMQGSADDSIAGHYVMRINTLAEQRKLTMKRLAQTKETLKAIENDNRERGAVLDQVRLLDESFWQQEEYRINQMLHRLMGKNRVIVLNGEIIGFAAP